MFVKTCDYLGQNLQPQQVTVDLLLRPNVELVRRDHCKMVLANMNKYYDWTQPLVLLAKKLKVSALIWKHDGDDDLADAAEALLSSKMAEASNTTCQIHIAQAGSSSYPPCTVCTGQFPS